MHYDKLLLHEQSSTQSNTTLLLCFPIAEFNTKVNTRVQGSASALATFEKSYLVHQIRF